MRPYCAWTKNSRYTEIATLSDLRSRTTSRQRFTAILLSAFAAFSVFLAAIGVYGLLAWAVSLRTEEFGIRMALGATPARVGRLIVGQVGVMTCFALLAGGAASVLLSRVLTTLLFGVTPYEPVTYIIVALIVISVAFAAAIAPARQACSVDPADVLRRES